MNIDNTRKLFDKYSAIFRGRYLSMQENLMCFGFECGDGWYGIIDDLCGGIQQAIVKDATLIDFMVTQVKEKYGTLRFYTGFTNDAIEKLIYKACVRSAKTCESCGKPGKCNHSGWMSVRCVSCRRLESLAAKKSSALWRKKRAEEAKAKQPGL